VVDRLRGPRTAARLAAASARDASSSDSGGSRRTDASRSSRTSGSSDTSGGSRRTDASRSSRTSGSSGSSDTSGSSDGGRGRSTTARRSPPRRPAPSQRLTILGRGPRWWLQARVAMVVVAVALVAVPLLDDDDPPLGLPGVPAVVADDAPDVHRDVDVHAGYGTWVDVYDYLPGGSAPPPVTADTVADMADQGVRTLYLQAARFDEARSDLLTDPGLLAELLVRAHEEGMRVVGWYLPRFVDLDRDLAYLQAISDFEVLGHRFDGVAVDIEWTEGVPDHAERSERLVELSERLRDEVGDDALGAIVLPPVQIEVVNRRKWPDFPWREIADLYDVWLPMGYWTERAPESGYDDGGRYTDENIRRLRANLDDPDAPVHAIGGIGDRVTAEQAQRFADAIVDNDAIGGSIYDWSTLAPAVGADLAAAIPDPDD
jgi:hypothetical protein